MLKKRRKNKKRINAKIIFDKYLSKKLQGNNSDETINIFSDFSYNNFYDLAKKHKLGERQVSSLIGFKDEFFVAILITQIINELKLDDKFYCKKITANETRGLLAKIIKYNNKDKVLTIGGDCVIFRKSDNKPLMIIECKEYIDMIRMKELIGESIIIKGKISNSVNLLEDVKFCVFSEVLELTKGWSHLLENSDLKCKIDQVFVIRDGKRKDKENKPVKSNLLDFKKYITDFLTKIK
jgi:hypothetical protein